MIKYNLKCENDHEFESWFSDSKEFENLKNKRILNTLERILAKELEKFITIKKIIKLFMALRLRKKERNSQRKVLIY